MKMKKFINNQEDLTQELLEGLALANEDTIELTENRLIINKKLKDADRVGIVSLGGTGHEPALSGFVGEGMLDIAILGDVFAAPGPGPCLEAIRLADKGKGVLFIVLNHAGDMLTGDMVMKRVEKEGLNVKRVITQDDISNATRENAHDRRGLVGCVPTFKIAGGAAAAGKSLEEVVAITQRFVDNMATIAVASKCATHPSTGETISILGEDEMEIGMGQHGEGGGKRSVLKTADETTEIMLTELLADLNVQAGEELMVVVNGSGATTLMEQLIVFRKCSKMLKEKDIKIVANAVGELLTVQEMSGFQLFIARMDEELLGYWNATCKTPYMTK